MTLSQSLFDFADEFASASKAARQAIFGGLMVALLTGVEMLALAKEIHIPRLLRKIQSHFVSPSFCVLFLSRARYARLAARPFSGWANLYAR